MPQQPHAIIKNLRVSSNTADLQSLGGDVTALKIAVGLLFQKLPDNLRETYLLELRQLNNPYLNDLATQLEQFKV